MGSGKVVPLGKGAWDRTREPKAATARSPDGVLLQHPEMGVNYVTSHACFNIILASQAERWACYLVQERGRGHDASRRGADKPPGGGGNQAGGLQGGGASFNRAFGDGVG